MSRFFLAMVHLKHLIFLGLFITLAAYSSALTIPEKIQKSASLLESGDLQSAFQLLQEVLQESPNHGPAHLLLGQISFAQFQWEEAERYLKIAANSQTRRPQLAWHLLGKLYLLRHEYSKAKQHFDSSLKESPDFQPALLDRARASLFLNQMDSGILDLQKAQQSAEAKLLLAQLYLYQDRDREAATILQSLLSTQEEAKWLLLKSPRDLAVILGNNLGNDVAYFALGVARLRSNEPQQAETLFKIAFQLNDQNPVSWLFLRSKNEAVSSVSHPVLVQKFSEMTTLLEKKKLTEAKQIAEEVIAGCMRCIPAYLTMIQASEKLGNFWGSFEQQQVILKWLTDIPALYAHMANSTREAGVYDLAECSIRRALSMDQDNGSYHYLLAKILQAQKKTDLAIASSQKALALDSQNAAVYITLGNLYYEKMALSESIAALAKGIELDPLAAENIASFALSALTTEDYGALRTLLDRHLEAHPENVNTLYSLATMHLKESQLEKAGDYLSRLEKLAPEHPEVYYNLTLLFTRQGKQTEAAAALQQFRKLKKKEQQEWHKHNEAYKKRLQAGDLMRENKPKEAVLLYSKIVEEGLAEREDLLSLARAYDAAGEHHESLSTLQTLLKSSPYDKEVIVLLVQIAEQLGNRDLLRLYRSRLELLAPEKICTYS